MTLEEIRDAIDEVWRELRTVTAMHWQGNYSCDALSERGRSTLFELRYRLDRELLKQAESRRQTEAQP